MLNHEDKVKRIIKQLKEHSNTDPVSFKKKAVSHEVPKPEDKRHFDKKIDISDLNEILEIDPNSQICIAEPGVTFFDLVQKTLKYNLVPIIVPELKGITIGWAIAGCSIESMSFTHWWFHDTCIEYEVITAKGEVLTCTPWNDNKLIFQMIHGTFWTLWIISKLKFKLISAKDFVKVDYEKHNNLESYKESIRKHFQEKDIEFMDWIIHSPSELALSLWGFVERAPYTHNYDWMRVYYKSTKERKEDYLKTSDYFFRYDKGVTNVTPKSFLGRLIFWKFLWSTELLKIVNRLHLLIPSKKIPVTLDVFIPFSKLTEFMDWYEKEINFFPLRCVPYKIRKYEWINADFINKTKDTLFIDIAIYGLKKNNEKNYYKIIEDKLMEIWWIKTIISNNYYQEPEFWKVWNKDNYDKVKAISDPDNIFRYLFT